VSRGIANQRVRMMGAWGEGEHGRTICRGVSLPPSHLDFYVTRHSKVKCQCWNIPQSVLWLPCPQTLFILHLSDLGDEDAGICTIFFSHLAIVVVHFTVLPSIKNELGLHCAKLVEFITCLDSSLMWIHLLTYLEWIWEFPCLTWWNLWVVQLQYSSLEMWFEFLWWRPFLQPTHG
jgi:hypothetical protein